MFPNTLGSTAVPHHARRQARDDNRKTRFTARLGRGNHMNKMPMHPTVRDQAHQMRGAASRFHPLSETAQDCVGEETAVFNRKIDLAKVHRHDTTRANVRVPHFGIAHLAPWQTNVWTVSDQSRIWARCQYAIHRWCVCQGRRVALSFRTQTPSIKNT